MILQSILVVGPPYNREKNDKYQRSDHEILEAINFAKSNIFTLIYMHKGKNSNQAKIFGKAKVSKS